MVAVVFDCMVGVVELSVIGVVALFTSALTAVAGSGGGLILLIVLLQFVDPTIAIPIHGVIQLLSNSARAASLRERAELRLLRWYVVPLLPATFLGFLIADSTPKVAANAVIGVFALMAVWWPAATAWLVPRPGEQAGRFAIVGTIAGVANPTIGAPGPLLAPAFRSASVDHVGFVATFAVAQVLNHSTKVLVFAIAGVAWSEHAALIAVAGAGVLIGTRVGTAYVTRADEALLHRLFLAVVTAGAAKLILGVIL